MRNLKFNLNPLEDTKGQKLTRNRNFEELFREKIIVNFPCLSYLPMPLPSDVSFSDSVEASDDATVTVVTGVVVTSFVTFVPVVTFVPF